MIHRLREPEGEAAGALVLLHGRGADEHDLFGLLGLLDPERRLLGVTPGGPLHLPPGGRHWYVVKRVGFPDPETFHPTYAQLTEFLDGLLAEHGIEWKDTVIGGFSQGTAMAYATALGAGRPSPAGIVALSGFIPTVDGLAIDLEGAPPVAIGHGKADPVISVAFARDARARLEAAGANVNYAEHPGGHHVDPRFVGGLSRWVEEIQRGK